MASQLKIPNCQFREDLPLCGPLQSVINLSDAPIRIEGWFDHVGIWAPIIPEVEPASEHRPFACALWLPKNTLVRSVKVSDGSVLTTFGAVGNGLTAVQQSSMLTDTPK